jgi:uncharacterized protein YjbI with pentapeptide repeats
MRHANGSVGHALSARGLHRLVIALALFIGLVGFQVIRASSAEAQPGTATWTQAAPSTIPPALQAPTMAFDTSTSQLVLAGEVPGDTLEETWLWDGTNWVQVFPDASPPAAYGASMAYDADTNQLLLFGGMASGNTYLNDTWTWNGSSWVDVTPGSGNPPGRDGASMAYDASTSQLVLYGGSDGSDLNDTWDWNGSSWTDLTSAAEPSVGHSFASTAYDPDSGQLVIFGGSGYADTWNWDGTNWNQLAPETTPGQSSGAPMAYDASTDQVIYFGGEIQFSGGGTGFPNETFNWDGSAFDLLSPSNSPEGLAYSAMAYDPESSQLVMFGGYDGSNYVSDTWIYANPTPDNTCNGFTDNFQSGSLSSNWETDTPLTASVAQDSQETDVSPQLQFSDSGMDMQGATQNEDYTAIQSVQACEGPMSFDADVEGLQSNGDAFVIQLVSADQSQTWTVSGDLNPDDAGYGIWSANPQSESYQSVLSSPSVDVVYDVGLSIDRSGNGTVTVTGSGVDATVPVGSVGTGPFYVLLGQSEVNPASEGPNEALWSNAVLTPSANVTASLSTSSPTVAGVETVPESAVSAQDLSGNGTTGSGGAASAPLSSIPLSSIGLASSPLSSIPLSSIPFSSIGIPGSGSQPSGIEAAAQALDNTLLSNISITYPSGCGPSSAACTGWNGVLAGTSYENVPLEAVTLGEVLANSTAAENLDSVDLGALDLSSSPLTSIPLSSIELGATPLSSIGLGGTDTGSDALSAWCAELQTSSIGSSCADFGIDSGDSSTDVTLLSLALAGVPLSSIPLSSIPLSSIALGSSPLSSIPLSSIDLESNPLSSIPLSSIPLSSTPLSSIPLSSIGELSDVVDCNTYQYCSSGTLGDAYTAGAILSGATLGELGTYGDTTIGQLLTGDSTSTSGYPSLDLGDLVLSTIPPASYQWQAVNLSGLPLAGNESSGGTVSYTVNLSVINVPTGFQASVTLPPTFAYLPGSSSLDGAPIADPTIGSSLDWSIPQLSVGPHTLTFEADAGTGLGQATASVSTSIEGTVTSSSSASVEVVDGEEPQIDSASTPFPLTAGVLDSSQTSQGDLSIGYLTSPGDLNDWSVDVPQGAELSVALSNLPATYDLELFGPGGTQLQGTPAETIDGVTDTLPSLNPGSTSESTPGSQDLPVTPPAGDVLEAISNNPDAQSQYIQTTPLTAGTYTVQVSGYDGSFSTQPYLLQANILGGATSPSCPDGISYLGSVASQPPASGPVTIPNGANTLFLVDTQRLSAAFGTSDKSQIMTDLQNVATDRSAGVIGGIVPVDSYSSVQDAYSTWNANPCSVDAANGVVSAISSVIDQIRASTPSIQNLVIVGADDQIPFARIPDGATESNERDYGASTFAGENNPEADALSLGYYESDDPYAASNPLGVGSATLYLPQVAVGRLVESPTEIESALTRFVSSDGDLDATASLTTGYSFLTSGANAVSANLAQDGLTPSTLINETWDESDLDSALAASPTPGVDSINAHFDYSRALPAYDNTNGVETNLFTTSDVSDPPDPTSYAGRLLFSMGCHAGLDVDDAEVSTSGVATPVDDWAKTFADAGALWVANTGYGYADTDTIAYSAQLMSQFAGELNGSLTIGEALSAAKQQYAAGNAILSPYDLKALMESTLYGLPMYHLNTSGSPVAPPNGPPTTTDPTTGLTEASVSANLTTGSAPGQLSLVSTGNGNYYQVNGTTSANPGTQTTEFRPIEPLVEIPATEPNLVAHGALLTDLESTDTEDFTPAYSLPAAGSAESTPATVGDAAFPGTLQRVATYGTFTSTGTSDASQLDLIAGQFLPNPTTPGVGTQRIFKSISADVFYDSPSSPLADDYAPPTIQSSQAFTSSSGVNFSVQVTPSSPNVPVLEVLVLYTDASDPGAWTPVTLSSSQGSETWTTSVPATPSGQVQYIVEAVDAAGNVAVSNNEGADFDGTAQPAISISLSGSSEVDGYYTGPVTADIAAPAGSDYVLDGAASVAVPSDGLVDVTGGGEHTITVTDPDGDVSTQTFAISTSQTSTTLSSSVNPSVVGDEVTYTATVDPATTGAGTPTGDLEFLQGTTPIAGCGGSDGTGLDGSGSAQCQVAYSETGTQEITATYFGDSSFAGSSSATLPESVIDFATVTTLSSSTNPQVLGKPLKFKALVQSTVQGSGTPNGNVEFLEGSRPVSACGGSGGEPVNNSGAATCSQTFRKAGVDEISAVYLGSGPFVSSSSPGLSEIVTRVYCSTFVHCNLSGLDLKGANLQDADLRYADMVGTNLTGANLSGADAIGADFQGANMTSVSAVRVDMAGDDLRGSNLTFANFTRANLSGADLEGSKRRGTNFTDARLRGTQF